MTVRNVGIVFAPTLNIPAPVFSMFLTDFDAIFGDAGASPSGQGQQGQTGSGPGPGVPTVELTVDHSLSPDEIRSPRHQMFSDIPTPSYNQTSFRGDQGPASGPGSASGPGPGMYQPYPGNDTGFISMQPSYDQGRDYSQYPGPAGGGAAGGPAAGAGGDAPFSSLNGMLSSPEDTRSAKTKRRESSMLFMENRESGPVPTTQHTMMGFLIY